ncbi:uncharacterized protein JN550_012886 [Neoarthrinium moseri]|uniref:uncharacterized protein n=1 Tax=Neoarthrinium moseri TaxID=1658444 RepID=UPI001FDCEE7D|nr:uncharacterized protein JN550_012886 [Neoarthrinium moseri]KAI1858064.1 hypothetical protein JN550_012886 [Neoarthrinium moseri]
MEPLSALGIACNLMQVISFTGEVIHLCKQVYKRGSQDPSLEGNAKALSSVITSLHDSLTSPESRSPCNEATRELQDLARKCLDATSRLSAELDKIGASRSQGHLGKTMVSVCKHLAKSGDLRNLEKEIHGYQKVLESGLLVRLCTAREAADLQSREGFKQLNGALQHFIISISKQELQLSQLLQAVDQRIEKGFFAIQDEATRARILGSLKYEGMNRRKNDIKENHRKTFEWIFKSDLSQMTCAREELNLDSDSESDSISSISDSIHSSSTASETQELKADLQQPGDVRPSLGDSFVTWLLSNDTTYWISGKPGSGKSTLMLFLLKDPRTQGLLNMRSPDTLIIGHFLLSSGHPMQRNTKGILCSLLHQILQDDDRHERLLLPSLAQRLPLILSKDSPDDWTPQELKQAIRDVLKTADRATCIFIDGLDELAPSEIEDDLRSLLRTLGRIPCVKLCVSSRPEPTFQALFDKIPKLRVQSLTDGDIRRYAWDFLKSAVNLDERTRNLPEIQHFVDLVSERSDGVFLWVYLVLKRLHRGLTNKDSITELIQRLEQTPKELQDLFSDMWGRLGEDAQISEYLSTAAKYFHFVKTSLIRPWSCAMGEAQAINVAELMLATNYTLRHQLLNGSNISPKYIEERCDAVIRNLDTRCAGLLECKEHRMKFSPAEESKYNSQFRFHSLRVEFVHRSALDYIFSSSEGSNILVHDDSTPEEQLAMLNHVDLTVAKMWELCDEVKDFQPCLTLGSYLFPLFGHPFGSYSHFLSETHRHSLLSLGGSVYTRARIDNQAFFPFFRGPNFWSWSPDNSPDFIMVLSQSPWLGLVPQYMNYFDQKLPPAYAGYIMICICTLLGGLGYHYDEPEARAIEDLCSDVESTTRYLLDSGADIHMEGLSSIDLDQISIDTMHFTHSQLQSSVSTLALGLFDPCSCCIHPLLRVIHTFLDNKASLNRIMVFHYAESNHGTPESVRSGIFEPVYEAEGTHVQLVVFKTTPGHLLRLALYGIQNWPNLLKNLSKEAIETLLQHTALTETPAVLEPLAFRTTMIDPPRLHFFHKLRTHSQKQMFETLVSRNLTSMAWWRAKNEGCMPLPEILAQIAAECETVSSADFAAELEQEGYLVRVQDYLKQIPRLEKEQELALLDKLQREAFDGKHFPMT